MCGIAGFFSRAEEAPGCLGDLSAAMAALRHRGPDDNGIWHDGKGVGFGHARLSILDLSPHGHQPMVSPDGRLVLVFNGEVYNFKEIRRNLESLGHCFRGSGDTEVILAAFRQWGVQAVNRFIGMFAIALWDTHEHRLTLLRDRLGVKPLYYGWDGRTLWFGSELKALRAFRHWRPEIDPAALAEYFQFGYINAPRSIYRQVFKLPPGHWLELGLHGEPVVRQFWSVLDALDVPLTGSEDELAEQLESLMIDAFRLRMVSDVPVGMFLSGGIDSSLVTALLQKHHGNIHTFTIGFNEAGRNEAPHARRVAEYLGTNHTERILETDEAKRILPRWSELYDEPFQDPSGIPTYLVSKVASEQVKVVLSADGGDELFSGYGSYAAALREVDRHNALSARTRRVLAIILAAPFWEGVDRLVTAMPLTQPMISNLRRTITRTPINMRRYLTAPSLGAIFESNASFWRPDELVELIGTTPVARASTDAYPGSFSEQMCLWDMHNYLPGDILAKVDRATMAVSIEGREPLIDHRIVEFAYRMPLSLRRGLLGSKHILRKILYRYLPHETVDRPKMGFGVPLLEWLRGDLSYLLDDHLNDADVRSQGVLNPVIVNRTVRAFRRGDDYAVNQIWTLLAFQMWRHKWG